MPYSPKAHRLFEGIAHGSIPPKKGLSKAKAAQLGSEGVKRSGSSAKQRTGKVKSRTGK